jgi:hypothetical protein
MPSSGDPDSAPTPRPAPRPPTAPPTHHRTALGRSRSLVRQTPHAPAKQPSGGRSDVQRRVTEKAGSIAGAARVVSLAAPAFLE